MADELREIIDSVRDRLQVELEAQLNTLKERHQEALAEARRHAETEARRAAEAEAEQALAVKTQIIKDEAQRRAQEAVAAVREEVQRRAQEAITAARDDAQRRAQEAVLAIRDEAQRRAQEAITALHDESQRRAQEAIAAVRAELEREKAADATRLRAEAEQRATEAAARVRAEMDQALASEREQARVRLAVEQQAIEAASRSRLELEQALATEREDARSRAEASQQALDAATRARAELEQALAAERDQARRRADAEQEQLEEHRRNLEEDHRRAVDELEKARASFDASRAADRAHFESERSALEAELAARAVREAELVSRMPPPGAAALPIAADRLAASLREIDQADSVSSTLAAIGRVAAQHAARAAVFVASGEQLREWDVPGSASLTPAPLYIRDSSLGILAEAVSRRELVRAENGNAPAFAALGSGRTAAATPLLLDGQSVGVLYADEGPEGTAGGGEWIDALAVIASHGSARLGYITAVRTAQAQQWLASGTGTATTSQAPSASEDEEQAAKRYARLVISEIKLYNEEAVAAGRELGDLQRRLGPEIDRARRLFDERVPATLHRRASLFHQELVQTLAGGDPSRLG